MTIKTSKNLMINDLKGVNIQVLKSYLKKFRNKICLKNLQVFKRYKMEMRLFQMPLFKLSHFQTCKMQTCKISFYEISCLAFQCKFQSGGLQFSL